MTGQPSSAMRFVFLDYLRALACWLVVWDHLANIMPGWANKTWPPAQWVHNNIVQPLGIIQDFGWFGVALFFLISGFIITDRARVESMLEFVTKRVLRIYPMLAITVLLSAAFVAAKDQVTVRNVLLNITLANYVISPQVVLLGVAWTLIIEVIFYALTAVTQIARNSPHRIALNLAFIAIVVWKRGAFGPGFTLFAVSVSYLPILVMGQTINWWLSQRRLTAIWGVTYLAAACALFLRSMMVIQPAFIPATNSYMISVAYALLLFAFLVNFDFKENKVVRFLSNTSYSLYLLHGITGFLVLAALIKRAPLTVAIVLAAAASLLSAWIAYVAVERPMQAIGRRIPWTRKPPAETPAFTAAKLRDANAK
jgi:peptidoglycan/LPS O-acetylase OafA/YrhL